MAKRMLIDAAHPEETRVVVLSGSRLEEFDFETSTKKQIKGNIYLAKVTRVEPSLQAAFVEYGGNRHGFLAFSEIHPDYYRIPIADRQAALAADRAAQQAANAREDAEGEPDEAERETAESPPTAEESHWSEDPGPDRMAHAAPADVLRGPVLDEGEATPVEPSTVPDAFTTPAEPSLSDPEASTENEAPPRDAADACEAPSAVEMSAETSLLGAEDVSVAAPEARQSDTIETVGGDEIEESTRPRGRPFRHYKIQEVIKRRQIMLVQVTKEERGNKGAALTTYLSLAGRYCVLMPNTPRGGGVSRKITNNIDRRRLKDLVSDLDMPEGMGVIVRTAGSERSKTEIKRDFEYLLRLWDEIRGLTLQSTAPALIYEEGNLIKRSIRDLYARDIEEVVVDGSEGYRSAKAFMKMLMPSHAKRVKPYRDPTVPLFHRFQVEGQIDAIHSPTVQLRSGGYIVINPTEALVAIDVNSGRSTKERNIEETALKTNGEAAEEIARQLRLRDLAGLIVIDFIDMEEHRNQATVERRLKEAMRYDRARIQLGRISPFGLLELSRQRLRPSLLEASTQPCPRCNGTGHIRSTESTALHVLRAIEEEGMRRRSAEIVVAAPTLVALYILNQKRAALQQTEARYGFQVAITNDDSLVPPAFRLDRQRALTPAEIAAIPTVVAPMPEPEEDEDESLDDEAVPPSGGEAPQPAVAVQAAEPGPRRRRRRRDSHRDQRPEPQAVVEPSDAAERPGNDDLAFAAPEATPAEADPSRPGSAARAGDAPEEPGDGDRKRRRRGRRGGRRRRRTANGDGGAPSQRDDTGQPQAEVVELVAIADDHDDDVAEIAEAFTESSPALGALETASVPIADRGDSVAALDAESREVDRPAHAVTPMPPQEPRPAPEEAERTPAQYNAPPTHEVTGSPANPRRGWWRR